MKSVMSATQRSSSTSVIATPCSASQSCPPEKVRASPTTTAPMPNWRTSPEQYQHGESVVTITVLR
jgi:hypothetical protein